VTEPKRLALRPVILVSGALVRPFLLRLLGWDRDAIERALERRPRSDEVVAVEDARREAPAVRAMGHRG
jgi:hypothetical protein